MSYDLPIFSGGKIVSSPVATKYSLLENVPTAVTPPTFLDNVSTFMPMIGGIVSAIGGFAAQKKGLQNHELAENIKRTYGEAEMSRRVANMMGGAIDAYGHSLVTSSRAGGTMETFSSKIWQGLSQGTSNYLSDVHAMQFNGGMSRAAFSAMHGANRMLFFAHAFDELLQTHDAMASKMPSGTAKTKEERVRF
jgi:hypothetical protein